MHEETLNAINNITLHNISHNNNTKSMHEETL